MAPKMETNQTLAELADLLGAQNCPVDQEDATSVERDVIHILRLTGPMAALNTSNWDLQGAVSSPRWRCLRRSLTIGA